MRATSFASPGPAATRLRLLAATHERWLYLALLVRDDKLVFDASMLAPLDSATIGDRIWLAFDDKRGGQQQLFFGSTGAGKLRGRRIETREYGREEAVEEPRIEAVWQRSARRLRAGDRHPAVDGGAAHRRAHRRSRPARRGARELRHARSRRTCAPPAG